MQSKKRARRKGPDPDPRPVPPAAVGALPAVLAGVLILCFVVQCLAGMRQQSATFDEPVYIAAGYSYVETGDFRLKQDAPPLVSTLSGIALKIGTAFGNTLVFDADSRLWSGRTEYAFAQRFLAAAGSRQRTIQIARFPVVMIGALLAFYLFRFGRILFGDDGDYWALLPLLLFCFDPNMIAHARTVSNDMAVAVFFLIAHFYLYRLAIDSGRANQIALAVAIALTTVAKFSGLLVFPSLLLTAAVLYVFPAAAGLPPERARAAEWRRRFLAAGVRSLVMSMVASLLIISALYQSTAGPAQYLSGVRSIYANVAPGFQFYLLGGFSPMASWYYYLVAMAAKTPDVAVVLFVVAVGSLFIRDLRPSRHAWLLAPVALVEAACSQDPANLGLRRVLLVYPFLFLWIGVRCRLVWARWWPDARRADPRVSGGMMTAAAAVVLFAIVSAIRIHPYQLAYFNAFAGGPAAGPELLDDSNIDWGQDLPGLAEWQAGHSSQPLALDYFGTDDPAGYGIISRPISEDELFQPGRTVYALSVNSLIRLKLSAQTSGRAEVDWLARYTPTARIGYSIYVYDFR
jgi:hypothetical protein